MKDLLANGRLGFLLLLFCSPPATPAVAQEDGGLFFDTVDVNVVNLEVVVTDADGEPITGLTAEDFEVFEDGEPVALTNFFAVENRLPVIAEGEEQAVAPAPATQRLNLVIFVDNLNIQPHNRKAIFESLRQHLEEHLHPEDRVMLVTFNESLEIVQEPTEDLGRLYAKIDEVERRVGLKVVADAERRMFLNQVQRGSLRSYMPAQGSERDPDFELAIKEAAELALQVRGLAEAELLRTRRTLEALKAFSASLGGVPGRKAVVYLSDGLPLRPADALVEAWTNKYDRWVLENSSDILRFEPSAMSDFQRVMSSMGSAQHDLSNDFERLVEAASSDRVAFYPISNGGRQSSMITAETASFSRSAANLDAFTREEALLDMAEGTGGVAFTRTSHFGGLLERLRKDFESFYSLGFRAPPAEEDRFHKIEVKVRRDGARVRHLKGYRQQDPLEKLRSLTLSALRHGVGENTLEVRLDPGEQTKVKGDRYRVAVMVKIPFQKLLLLPEEKSHTGRVTLFVAVEDLDEGGVSSPQRIDLPIQIPNERILEAMSQVAAYPLQLDMKPGPKRVALGVRDDLGQTESTVSVELEVGAGSG